MEWLKREQKKLEDLKQSKIRQIARFKQEIDEIRTMWNLVENMFEEADLALKNGDVGTAKKMLIRENAINQLQEEFKHSHIKRLNGKTFHLDSGFVFLEFIDNLEKIGDRLTNVAQSIMGEMKWEPKKPEREVSV